MANFIPIQNEFSVIVSTFNESVNDGFGTSIKHLILEEISESLNQISIFEENDKRREMFQIEQLLVEARLMFS